MNCRIRHARDPGTNSGSGSGAGTIISGFASGTTLTIGGTCTGPRLCTTGSDTNDDDDGVREQTRGKTISPLSSNGRIGDGPATSPGGGTWLTAFTISTATLGLCLLYLGLYAGSSTCSNDFGTAGCLKAGSATKAKVFLLYILTIYSGKILSRFASCI